MKIIVQFLVLLLAFTYANDTRGEPRPRYRVIELPTLPGSSNSWALALNNRGDILGLYENRIGAFRVFLFTHGQIVDLGQVTGAYDRFDINASGQIVAPVLSAFYTSKNVSLPPAYLSGATGGGLNDAGIVAGAALTTGAFGRQVGQGFLYKNGEFQWLTPYEPGGGTALYRVNNRGQAAGSATTNGQERAMLYSQGQIHILGVLQPGDLSSRAIALNDLGHVIGSSDRFDEFGQNLEVDGFFYRNQMTKLAGLPDLPFCYPQAINNYDEIVGECRDLAGAARGFLQTRHGTFYDLNKITLGRRGVVTYASDINESGWIVGVRVRKGVSRAVLLKPVGAWKKWRGVQPDVQ